MPGSNKAKNTLSYSDIEVRFVDLFDDAWGFSSHYHDIFSLLSLAATDAPEHIVSNLMGKIEEDSGEGRGGSL